MMSWSTLSQWWWSLPGCWQSCALRTPGAAAHTPQDAPVLFWGWATLCRITISRIASAVCRATSPSADTVIHTGLWACSCHWASFLDEAIDICIVRCWELGFSLQGARVWRWSTGCLCSGCRLHCSTSCKIISPVKPCTLYLIEEASHSASTHYITWCVYWKNLETFMKLQALKNNCQDHVFATWYLCCAAS